jgi:hypothetical protein
MRVLVAGRGAILGAGDHGGEGVGAEGGSRGHEVEVVGGHLSVEGDRHGREAMRRVFCRCGWLVRAGSVVLGLFMRGYACMLE